MGRNNYDSLDFNNVIIDGNFLLNKYYKEHKTIQEEVYKSKFMPPNSIFMNKYIIWLDSLFSLVFKIDSFIKTNISPNAKITFTYNISHKLNYERYIYDYKFKKHVDHNQYLKNTMYIFKSIIKYILPEERYKYEKFNDLFISLYPNEYSSDIWNIPCMCYDNSRYKYLYKFISRIAILEGRLSNNDVLLLYSCVISSLKNMSILILKSDYIFEEIPNEKTLYITKKSIKIYNVYKYNLKNITTTFKHNYIPIGINDIANFNTKKTILQYFISISRCFGNIDSNFLIQINDDVNINIFLQNPIKLYILNENNYNISPEQMEWFDINYIDVKDIEKIILEVIKKYNKKLHYIKLN